MLKTILFATGKRDSIISLYFCAILCLNSSLEAKPGLTYLFANIISTSEITTGQMYLDSDINVDWKVDIKDLALWFNFLVDSSLATRDTVLYRGINLGNP